MEKLRKHLSNPKKTEKVLSMITDLITDHFDFLSGDSLFTTFSEVMALGHKFKTA